jgi:hypothetical protein
LKLIFLNDQSGKHFGRIKVFEEPISYAALCRKLDPESRDEEVLEHWLLSEVDCDPFLRQVCFSQAIGFPILESRETFDFVADIFEELENEERLAILARAAILLGLPFDNFIWIKWRCVLDESDEAGLKQEFGELDPAWKRAGSRDKVPLSELQAFARQHSNQVLEVNGCYIFLV